MHFASSARISLHELGMEYYLRSQVNIRVIEALYTGIVLLGLSLTEVGIEAVVECQGFKGRAIKMKF